MFDPTWIKNFSDALLPFSSYSPINLDALIKPLEYFVERIKALNLPQFWSEVGTKLGERGWVLSSRRFTLDNIMSLIELLDAADYVKFNDELVEYYTKYIDEIVQGIQCSTVDSYHKKALYESVTAFKQGLFHPAFTSLTAIIEGVLVDATPTLRKGQTNLDKRIEDLEASLSSDKTTKAIDFMNISAMKKIMETFAESLCFGKEEPQNCNRHWLLHGRTRRQLEEKEYYQLLSFLEGLIELAFDEAEAISFTG